MDKFRRPAGTTAATTDAVPIEAVADAATGDVQSTASALADSVSADPVTTESVPAETLRNRARSRDSLFLIAQLHLGTERNMREVRVRNLSEGGLMLEIDKIVEVGTVVRLDLRGIGETTGKVAWCTAGRIGVALDSPIDPKKARRPFGGMKIAPAPLQVKAPDRI